MRPLIILITGTLILFSCGQGNTKQKESIPNEKDTSASIIDSNKNQEIVKNSQDNNIDDKLSLDLAGEWKDCKGKMGSITLTKTQDGFLLKPNSANMAGDVNLKKEKDGYYVDPVLGFILKYDNQKKHLLYDAGFGNIDGTKWIEYCRTTSESKKEIISTINLEGSWYDCEGDNTGFKLIKQGGSYSMQQIKGYWLPCEKCFYKEKEELYYVVDDETSELRYNKVSKKLHYWDGGGNEYDFCKKD